MSERQQPPEGNRTPDAGREVARRLAAAHTEVSREMEAFLRRTTGLPDAAQVAEFTALLAREEAVRADRDAAMAALGLQAPSVESP